MGQSLTPEQIVTDHLTSQYSGLQMKTGDVNVALAASSNNDYNPVNTGVAKFPNNLLFWQIFPYAPQNSWAFYLRGSSMSQGATNLELALHVQNDSGATNTVQFHWVAWGN